MAGLGKGWAAKAVLEKDLKDLEELTQAEHDNKVYVGIIKHLNAKSGFGIIACSDTRRIFGCDVPFLCLQLNRFSVGDNVHFNILFDPAKGTPQAFDLSMAAQMQTTMLERRALLDEPLRIKFVPPRNMAVQTRPSKRRKRKQKKAKKAAKKKVKLLLSKRNSLKRELAEARLLSYFEPV